MSFQRSMHLTELCVRLPYLATLILSLSTQVKGWGHEGHCIVANIAYGRLSPGVQDTIKSILNNDVSDTGLDNLIGGGYNKHTHGGGDDPLNTSPLAAVANWADKVRFTSEYHWSTPLHFVDIQDNKIEGGCPCTRNAAASATGDGENVGDMFLLQNDESCTLHSSCWFVYERDCARDFCAVGGIVNYTSRLVNTFHSWEVGTGSFAAGRLRGGQPRSLEEEHWHGWPAKEALMFLTHFIGDIHQPLHASRGSDRGGNSIHVHFDGGDAKSIKHIYDARTGAIQKKGDWNLHSVWDDGLIDTAIRSMYNSSQVDFQQAVLDLVREVESSGFIDAWLRCADGINAKCSAGWAEESFEDALRWAYSDENGNEVVDGTVLSEKYFATRLHVVTRRLAAAGVRLGAVLENALSLNTKRSAESMHPKLAEMLTSIQKPMMLLS